MEVEVLNFLGMRRGGRKGRRLGRVGVVREREFTDMDLELSPGEDLCIRAEMWGKINESEGLGKRKQGWGKIRRRQPRSI